MQGCGVVLHVLGTYHAVPCGGELGTALLRLLSAFIGCQDALAWKFANDPSLRLTALKARHIASTAMYMAMSPGKQPQQYL